MSSDTRPVYWAPHLWSTATPGASATGGGRCWRGSGCLASQWVTWQARLRTLRSTRYAAGAALSACPRASPPMKAPLRVRGVLTLLFAPAAPACGTSRPGRLASGASHARCASRWRCPGLQLRWRHAGSNSPTSLGQQSQRRHRIPATAVSQGHAAEREMVCTMRSSQAVGAAAAGVGRGGTTAVCSPCSLHHSPALTTHRLAPCGQPAGLVGRPRGHRTGEAGAQSRNMTCKSCRSPPANCNGGGKPSSSCAHTYRSHFSPQCWARCLARLSAACCLLAARAPPAPAQSPRCCAPAARLGGVRAAAWRLQPRGRCWTSVRPLSRRRSSR